MSEDDEKSILDLLLEELNSLYPLNLCTDVFCDRFMEEEVFSENTMDLVLIGASHLPHIKKHISQDKWNILDLTRPGWRINMDSVERMATTVTTMATGVDWDTTTVIIKVFDNSVYMVGSPGAETGSLIETLLVPTMWTGTLS
jgi:hypothetical protein